MIKNLVKILTCCAIMLLACEGTTQEQEAIKDKSVKEETRYVHAHGMPSKGKILMVVSSPAVSEQTGWPIGF